MMPTTSSGSVERDVRRAVDRIRAYGIDGPRPIEEIEAVMQHGDAVPEALRRVIEAAEAHELAAAAHLVSLLRCDEALDAVGTAALGTAAPLEAKREAIEAFAACERPCPAAAAERLRHADEFLAAPVVAHLERVLALPEEWRVPVVQAWLQDADSQSVEVAAAALGRDPGLDRLLLEWLGRQGTTAAAVAVRDYLGTVPDRERAKIAKRALHLLRTQGLEVEVAEDAAERRFTLAIETDPLAEASAWITSVDGSGARLVWILWPSPSGGNRLLQAAFDDATGLREAELVPVTRRDFRDYLERLRGSSTLWVDRIDASRAARHLDFAAGQARRAGRELPAAWARWEEISVPQLQAGGRLAEEPPGEPRARIYEHVDGDEVRERPDLRDEAVKLLREPPFSTWAIAGEVVERAAEEVRNAETSTVMVDDEQRRRRVQSAIRTAVGETFDDVARRRWRRRLESMASMLWRRDRADEARQALAAAVGFTEFRDLFAEHAFARALVHRGVWLAYQERRRDEESGGRSRLIHP